MALSPVGRGSSGFTLLEVLVAAALFALVMLLAGGATSMALKGWREAGARAEQSRRLAAAHLLVRRLVSEAWPAADGKRIAFAGEPDRLRLVSLGPMGTGRQTAFELRLAGGALEAVSAALDPAERLPFAALARGRSTVLLDRLAGGRFSYYGTLQPGRPPLWHDVWADPVSLPLLVRLRLDFPSGDGRRWPEMVAAPKMESPVTF
jgi:general secretion pathway protein J